MSSLVSIIIPAKNESQNIGRLLESIKKQTYSSIETIVVDDGSTDDTAEIAKRYTRKVFTRTHAERSNQRNFGASKARGKYLLFLDADMELELGVVKECVENIDKFAALTIPERTVGNSFIAKVRNFERQMYMGDFSIEVPRFFKTLVFNEFGGYDPNLTGPEDYDLPYRISKKYPIGRIKNNFILHHEENITLTRLLRKKYYYASRGALYAKKHPELVSTQGNLLFRKAYLKNWRNFLEEPILGISFIIIRILETLAAVLGFISIVGFWGFVKTFIKMFR